VVGVEDHGERVAGGWIDVDLQAPEPNGRFAVDKGAAHPDPPEPTGAGHGPPESPLESGALVSGDAVIEVDYYEEH